MPGYGFSCWNCREALNFDDLTGDDWREAENRAGRAGWCIGHFDGQGQIVCPDCRQSVWEPTSLETNIRPAKAPLSRRQ